LALLQVGFTLPRYVATRAVRSYRTLSPLPTAAEAAAGGLLSAALSVGSRPPGVTWHPALWSPDFPPAICTRQITGDCPADSRSQSKYSATVIQGLLQIWLGLFYFVTRIDHRIRAKVGSAPNEQQKDKSSYLLA
tara:strand:- start:109 stop:513 length:405 start_codon:yes stop_codon:yes gene_type:complete